MEKFYEPKFISDVYNNRRGKGIHKAIKKVQNYMNTTYGGYYLQLDIKGFFYNLDKDIFFKQLSKQCKASKIKNAYLDLAKHLQGLNFLGYITRENCVLTKKKVANNYKYKKAKYLDEHERQKEKMSPSEIKKFLSVKASFESHMQHSNSYIF